jgi:hypothetical protein
LRYCSLGFTLQYRNGSSHAAQVDATIVHTVFSSSHQGFVVGLQFRDAPSELVAALRRYLRG